MKCDLCGKAFEEEERFKYYNYSREFFQYKMKREIPNSYLGSTGNRIHYDRSDNFGLYLCFNCDSIKLKVDFVDIPKYLPIEQRKRFAITILRKGT